MEADIQVVPIKGMPQNSLDALAELHCEMLPFSVPALLGTAYAARFYAAVAKSSTDDVVVACDQTGAIVGAGLVTTKSGDLGRRMFQQTFFTFMIGALLNMVRGPGPKRRALIDALISPPLQLGAEAPVLIYLFVQRTIQQKGVGRIIVDALERLSGSAENRMMQVLTQDDSNNAALYFYARIGFTRQQSVRRGGNDFVVLERRYAAPEAKPVPPDIHGE